MKKHPFAFAKGCFLLSAGSKRAMMRCIIPWLMEGIEMGVRILCMLLAAGCCFLLEPVPLQHRQDLRRL